MQKVLRCVGMLVFQRDLLYFPQPRALGSPERTLTMPVDGAELVVTVRRQPVLKHIVYFGGDAADVSQSLDALAQTCPDRAVYLMHCPYLATLTVLQGVGRNSISAHPGYTGLLRRAIP
jgi:hypothetical protein